MTDTITIHRLTCCRCSHTWWPKVTDETVKTGLSPRLCPKCKSAYWDRPRKEDLKVFDPLG